MLTFVDDLGQVFKYFELRQLSSHSLSIKYSNDLCRHICKSFFKFAYLVADVLSGSTHNGGFQERIICYILYKDDDYIVFLFRNKSILIHVGKDCEATHLKRHVSIMSSAERK